MCSSNSPYPSGEFHEPMIQAACAVVPGRPSTGAHGPPQLEEYPQPRPPTPHTYKAFSGSATAPCGTPTWPRPWPTVIPNLLLRGKASPQRYRAAQQRQLEICFADENACANLSAAQSKISRLAVTSRRKTRFHSFTTQNTRPAGPAQARLRPWPPRRRSRGGHAVGREWPSAAGRPASG